MTGGASLFDRPGMGGSIAFRNTLFSFEKEGLEGSIGSAGSLVNEDDDDEVQIELPPFNEADFAPVAIFLTGLGTKYKKGQKALVATDFPNFFKGMDDWVSTFKKEEIDIHALTLLQEEDLKSMGLPLGPRKKVITAIDDRRKAMKEAATIEDSQL